MKSRRGFGLVEILIAVVVIAVIAGAGFYFKGGNNGSPSLQQATSDEQAAHQVVQRIASETQEEQVALEQASPSSPATSAVASTSSASPASTDPLVGLGGDKYADGILPLGDGKYVTTGPKKGYVYLCNVMAGGEGSQVNGSWIGTSTWNSNEKAVVQGSHSWPNASITISVNNGTRTIVTNDLPTVGTTGNFPIESTDPAYAYDSNPNSVEAQSLTFQIPASPSEATAPSCIYGEVGVMTNGVLLLDGFDEEYHDAAAHELQDSCEGHPHVDGVYHYHSLSSCIPNATVTNIIGWAFDGFPITGPEISADRYLTTSDLDECHGITSPVMLNGVLTTMYHYVMTQDFPYSVSCFRGKSYEPKGGGGTSQTSGTTQGQGGVSAQTQAGTPPAPPQAAITACSGKSAGAACNVNQGPTGICATIGSYFACKPN